MPATPAYDRLLPQGDRHYLAVTVLQEGAAAARQTSECSVIRED